MGETWPETLQDAEPKIFGVGIRARIRSSSSTVTRSRPLLRQDSSTAFTTMPRTNTGIFFMRAAAASSHAIVTEDARPYSIAPFDSLRSLRAGELEPRNVSRGDPANVPGVYVHRGSSAIRSPVMPYARARQPPQRAFSSHAPHRPPSELRRRMSVNSCEEVQRSERVALRREPAKTGRYGQ